MARKVWNSKIFFARNISLEKWIVERHGNLWQLAAPLWPVEGSNRRLRVEFLNHSVTAPLCCSNIKKSITRYNFILSLCTIHYAIHIIQKYVIHKIPPVVVGAVVFVIAVFVCSFVVVGGAVVTHGVQICV